MLLTYIFYINGCLNDVSCHVCEPLPLALSTPVVGAKEASHVPSCQLSCSPPEPYFHGSDSLKFFLLPTSTLAISRNSLKSMTPSPLVSYCQVKGGTDNQTC